MTCLGETLGLGKMSLQEYCELEVGAYYLASQPDRIVIPKGRDPMALCTSATEGAGLYNNGCRCKTL